MNKGREEKQEAATVRTHQGTQDIKQVDAIIGEPTVCV